VPLSTARAVSFHVRHASRGRSGTAAWFRSVIRARPGRPRGRGSARLL